MEEHKGGPRKWEAHNAMCVTKHEPRFLSWFVFAIFLYLPPSSPNAAVTNKITTIPTLPMTTPRQPKTPHAGETYDSNHARTRRDQRRRSERRHDMGSPTSTTRTTTPPWNAEVTKIDHDTTPGAYRTPTRIHDRRIDNEGGTTPRIDNETGPRVSNDRKGDKASERLREPGQESTLAYEEVMGLANNVRLVVTILNICARLLTSLTSPLPYGATLEASFARVL